MESDRERNKLNSDVLDLHKKLMQARGELRVAVADKAASMYELYNTRRDNEDWKRKVQMLELELGSNYQAPLLKHSLKYESDNGNTQNLPQAGVPLRAEGGKGSQSSRDFKKLDYDKHASIVSSRKSKRDLSGHRHRTSQRGDGSRRDTSRPSISKSKCSRSERKTAKPRSPSVSDSSASWVNSSGDSDPTPPSDSSTSSRSDGSDSSSARSVDERRASSRRKQKHSHFKHDKRHRSPQLPKMQTFSGDSRANWEAFILQFGRVAKDNHWKDSKKLRNLYQCLTGNASLYANKITVSGYQDLRKQLKRRFSKKEEASTARRTLRSVRQKEDETLEEFSQRVYFLADDAYGGESKKSLERNATEYFLLGCKDKPAALKAMEHKPNTIPKALKYIKQAQTITDIGRCLSKLRLKSPRLGQLALIRWKGKLLTCKKKWPSCAARSF
jgi:hypothetical protein